MFHVEHPFVKNMKSDNKPSLSSFCSTWNRQIEPYIRKKGFSCEVVEKLKNYFQQIFYYQKGLHLFSQKAFDHFSSQVEDAVEGSLCLLRLLSVDDHEELTDIGSGNGFPGLILGILKPELPVFLVERQQKKAQFLKTASLSLENVTVLQEEFSRIPKRLSKVSTSRAWIPLKELSQVEDCFPKGGRHYFFKGKNWQKEIDSCCIQREFKIEKVAQYSLPSERERFRCILRCDFK